MCGEARCFFWVLQLHGIAGLTLKESTILVVEDKVVVACFRLSDSREDEKEKGTRKYESVIALS